MKSSGDLSIRQFRGSKAAAYRMAWELRLHSADGQPRHKHFHLPHGLPLRRRACRRIRLPSLSDWRLEPSVTRPKGAPLYIIRSHDNPEREYTAEASELRRVPSGR